MIGPVAIALTVGLLGWAYQALKPPPPKFCGSPGGPPVTSPRVKLSDGRHLAYRELGVPKEEAKHKIIVIHGFLSSKDLSLPVAQELIEELIMYLLFFDKAGYGESDPYPSRSVKSEALLSGASLVVPFVNEWWPHFPADLARESLVARCTPWLFHWWMTQKWFPSLSILAGNTAIFCPKDLEMLQKLSKTPSIGQEKITQQGEQESLFRNILAGYGKWEFDPMDLNNPFPDNEGSVHIWQGYEDKIIPYKLNQIPDFGHFLLFDKNQCEAVLKALLLGL
ncbi:unnamed protein product [Malus baccata var. baccata]